MHRKRIVVGMSGGVDSSVAALLLKSQGHDVLGLFMKNWEDDDTDAYCTSREDLVDAVSVADRLGIDIETVNFSAEYKERVFAEFLAEYRAGRTPNPDVLCNAEIKFRAFLDHALTLGADNIATGHYARTAHANDHVDLLRGCDKSKDQSYFLYRLNQEQLARSLFPIGDLEKRRVRAIAREHGLGVHAKRDSTGICFIGERPFRAFLNRYLPTQPGEMCTPEGQAVGEHAGLMFYTIGQRQGLKIGGRRGGDGSAWYVVGKDIARNRLIVAQGHDHPMLFASALTCTRLNWTRGTAPDPGRPCSAKTRYRQQDAACRIVRIEGERCRVEFADPQWAVTPGQSIVLYDGELCLGGGIIETAYALHAEHGASLTRFSRAE
jgi:tRNA-specific 2-thiouridylase